MAKNDLPYSVHLPRRLASRAGRIGPAGLLGLLALLLFLGNLIHFLTRAWEASFYQVSYSTIYFPTDRPVVTNWQEVDGGIEAGVNWDAGVEGWRILMDGELFSENAGKAIFFPVNPEETENQVYTVVAMPEGLHPPFEMKVRYLSEAFNKQRGVPERGSFSIVMSDEPMAKFKQYPVSHWVDSYDYIDKDDLATTETILREEVGLEEGDTTLEKLEKLMVHQRVVMGQSCRGSPSPGFRWKTPYQIYQSMRNGPGTGWCTQHAQIFVYLANRAGLSSRIVQGSRTQANNFIYTGHTWVEAWIPEQGRWAWVEPSFGVIYATDKKGQVLNTVELANLRQHGAWDGVTARTYKDWGWPELPGQEGTLVDAPFADVGGVVERQFITSAIYKWRRPPHVEDLRYEYGMLFKNWTFTWGNFVRYYFKPPLAYANYPTEGNRTYLVRHLLLWSFLASAVCSLLLYRRRPKVSQ